MSKQAKNRRQQARHGGMAASFEQALLAIERHERPDGYAGFTAEHRREASRAQFLTFYAKYWPDWRHTKIRGYRFLLGEREAFLQTEAQRFQTGGLDPETVIYQEFTNGLLAAAASEFCQYAEDLGLLSHSIPSEDYFVRDLASASAGRIQQKVKEWTSITEEESARLLRIPWYPNRSEWQDSKIGLSYLEGLRLARKRLQDIGSMYRAWEAHFMRYKHGQLLALRYSPGVRETEFIERRRSNLSGFPVAFDCGSVAEAINRDLQGVLMIPDIGPASVHVRWNAAHLAAERNLLREVYPPVGSDPNIERFVEAAAWVSQCQRVLLENRRLELHPEPGNPYHIPHSNPAATYAVFREEQIQSPVTEGG